MSLDNDVVALLRNVSFLTSLDEDSLAALAARGRRVPYVQNTRIISELEPGADVYVVLGGRAEVSVEPRVGEKQVLGVFEAGDAFGEMSSVTGELRSATVTALSDVTCLVIADADFDRLREHRPEVARAMLGTLATRLARTEQAVDALLAGPTSTRGADHAEATAKAVGAKVQRGSIGRAYRELVVARRRDLAFLTLAAFVLTLVAVRLSVYASFRLEFAPRIVLRTAYITGFLLLGLSSATSLLTFRVDLRRFVAIGYGIGCALIFNSLGVTLAFDIFFKDIHTPDPAVAFDVERLYRRTEPLRAIVLALLVLVQAAYLRGFYRRVLFVLKTRLRRLLSRG